MAEMPLLLPLSVLLLSLFSLSTAEIKSLTITADPRPMILFEKFGFTHTGHVTISVTSVSVSFASSSSSATGPDPSRLGFFLLSEEFLPQVLVEIQQNPNFCVLDSLYILRLFNFRDLSPPPLPRFEHSYPVTAPNDYFLFFANCAPETLVSMSVKTEVYNLDRDGSRDYLSTGLTQTPSQVSFSSLYTYIPVFGHMFSKV